MSLFKVLSAQSETLRPVPHISSAYSGKALHFHYLFPPEYQTGCRAHPTSYWLGTGGIFPRVKRPGREADHLPAGCSLILACASKPCTGTAVLYVRQSLHEGAEVASSEGTWPFHRCVSYFILCDLSLRGLVQAASFLTWEVSDLNLARTPTIPTANIHVMWVVTLCELAGTVRKAYNYHIYTTLHSTGLDSSTTPLWEPKFWYPDISFRGLPQPLLSGDEIIPKRGPRAVPSAFFPLVHR